MQGIKVPALGKAELQELRHLETAGTNVLRTEKQDWLAVLLGNVSEGLCTRNMPEKMSELTQIKSSSGVCKPSMVRTAKVDDSSMKKMLSGQWHKAMQMALENVFGLAAWKTLVTCCLLSQ